LKGHTQTERMENKRTQLKIRIKKTGAGTGTGASRVRKDYDRIYYTTGANNKSGKSGKQNRTSHNLSDMSAQDSKKIS